MAIKIPLVLDVNGAVQRLQPGDMITIPSLQMGSTAAPVTVTTYLTGAWIDMPATGASGIGNGGPGQNAWIGYCYTLGYYCSDSVAGDIAYRNLGGRLLWGTSTGLSQMQMTVNGLNISTPFSISAPTTHSNTVVFKAGSGQVNQSISSIVAAQSGTTIMTLSNTVPASTTGTQIWSQVITPLAATSDINIDGSFLFDCGTAGRELIAMLFRGTVCIGVTTNLCTTVARGVPISFNFTDLPGIITPVTYSIRVALNASGTWYVNQTSTAYFGGMQALNGILVEELA